MNRQLWQRHGMVHIVADAVTSPQLAIHLFCARSFYGKMREDLDQKKINNQKVEMSGCSIGHENKPG